jgi:hypothetical protein
MNSEEI